MMETGRFILRLLLGWSALSLNQERKNRRPEFFSSGGFFLISGVD